MIQEIYLIHHSHTDIGYTNYQPTVMANQRAYLRQAMDLAERYADGGPGEQFKWTVEVLLTLEDFIQHAAPDEIQRLQHLHKLGLIDFGGLWGNWFPLADVQILAETLAVAGRLRRDYSFDILYGLNCDITGQPWGLVELMLDAGLGGLGMAMNRTMARDPQPRPRGFWWQGPSGRRLLVWHGEHYGLGQHYGIPRVKTSAGWVVNLEQSRRKLSGYLARLETGGYPYDFALFQITSTFLYDNGGPHEDLLRFVREWNGRGWQPRLRLATLSEFFMRLEQQPGLPVQCGDWTDWWTQGLSANSSETALARNNHPRLAAARTLTALLAGQPHALLPDMLEDEQAWRNLAYFDEHTWGSDESITHPASLATRSTLARKAVYAYDAHAAITRLAQGALRNLAARLPQHSAPHVLVFNPLPWARTIPLYLPRLSSTSWALYNLERAFELASPFSGLTLSQDYGQVELPAGGYLSLPLRLAGPVSANPTFSLEGMSKVVEPNLLPSIAPGLEPSSQVTSQDFNLQNHFYRLTVNLTNGSIASLVSLADGHEWVDHTTPWGLGHYIYETNSSPRGRRDMQLTMESEPDFDRQPALEPYRQGPERVLDCQFVPGVGKSRLSLCLQAPGTRDVRLQIVLYDDLPWIDLIYDIDKLPVTEPESVYIAFPLALQQPVAHYDTSGAVVQAETEQLPYACRDFYYVQSWVDASDAQRGLTLVTPDAALVHIGGFTNHKYQAHLQLEQPILVSWLMNNHWCTAFPASQQGWTRFTYRLLPHAAPFDPSTAVRLAAETTTPLLFAPVIDHPAGFLQRCIPFEPHLPETASLFQLQPVNVHLAGVRLVPGGMLLFLQETAGLAGAYRLTFPGAVRCRAERCDLLGDAIEPLILDNRAVLGVIEARSIQAVKVIFMHE